MDKKEKISSCRGKKKTNDKVLLVIGIQNDFVTGFLRDKDASSFFKDVKKLFIDSYGDKRVKAEKPILSKRLRQDNFIVNENNRGAYKAVFSMADLGEEEKNLLFIFGDHGSGKTHLLQAFGHYIEEHDPDADILYMTGVKFTETAIKGFMKGNISGFREKCRRMDYLLIDDIDFLIGKESSSNEMINLVKDLILDDKVVIVTSHRNFTEDIEVDEDYRAAFSYGRLIEIKR